MALTRKAFLRLGGGGLAGALLSAGLEPIGTPRAAHATFPLVKRIGEKTTNCPYDATGCGFNVAADGNTLINIEGDPEHPINRGGACSKGASLYQLRQVGDQLNPRRLTGVLYRAPGGAQWEAKPWDWAIDQIARKIKATRDGNWVEKDEQGYTVNRTEAIASVGGAALDNEECYLLVKALRSLGLVYVEHQARL